MIDIIDSLVNEGMEHSLYTKEVEKFNDNLKKLGSLFSVQIIPLSDVKPELEFIDPDEYIEYNGQTMEVMAYNGDYYQ